MRMVISMNIVTCDKNLGIKVVKKCGRVILSEMLKIIINVMRNCLFG